MAESISGLFHDKFQIHKSNRLSRWTLMVVFTGTTTKVSPRPLPVRQLERSRVFSWSHLESLFYYSDTIDIAFTKSQFKWVNLFLVFSYFFDFTRCLLDRLSKYIENPKGRYKDSNDCPNCCLQFRFSKKVTKFYEISQLIWFLSTK